MANEIAKLRKALGDDSKTEISSNGPDAGLSVYRRSPRTERFGANPITDWEGLLGFWNKGAKEFCVNVATEPRLTTREWAYLAGVIREAAMLPYRWIIKTPQKETTHTLEQMIEVALPVEKFRIKYDVSPKFYWRRGPGFIQIQDERHMSQSIYLLEEQEITLFEKLSIPFRHSRLSTDEAEVFVRFESVGLVSGINDWVFALPYRKRSWQAGEVQF